MQDTYIPSNMLTYRPHRGRGGVIRVALYTVISLCGLGLFIYPLFAATRPEQNTGQSAHSNDATFATLGLIMLLLVALTAELESRHVNARLIALLGVLVALDSALRVLPSIAGFSPVFFLILTVGYVYGAGIGFCMGALTLFVSALLTGGVGPWLPYQMFAAGWVGMLAGAAGVAFRSNRSIARISTGIRVRWREIILLAIIGFVMGLAYGAITDLWFWPFTTPDTALNMVNNTGGVTGETAWQRDLGIGGTLTRFGLFYVTTSLWYDMARAIGDVLLVAAFGPAVITILRRFQHKFFTQWVVE